MTQTKQKQGGQCCVISRKVVSSHAATVFRTDNVVSFHAKFRHHTQRRSSLLRRLTCDESQCDESVTSIWRHDDVGFCRPLQKPTSSCLQIDVTDSNLVQVLNYQSHSFTGSTETWTRIAGFRVQSAHQYTMEPNDTALLTQFLKSSPLRQCVHVCVCSNSRKSVPAFLSILSHRSVGGVVASIAAFQAVDLGSIPGRRKDVSGGLEFIQGDLVTPLLDVISPKANPFPPCNDY